MSSYDEDFLASLPRSIEGEGLMITKVRPDRGVLIGDGEGSAIYRPMDGEPLEGTELQIVPSYVEAGWYSEANVITLTDVQRTAKYTPKKVQ
jgi:hypothetical protein